MVNDKTATLIPTRPTSIDVAKKAGVSRTQVSYVLSGKGFSCDNHSNDKWRNHLGIIAARSDSQAHCEKFNVILSSGRKWQYYEKSRV